MDSNTSTYRVHQQALVIDCHSDVPMDVVNRRQNGEYRVVGRLHLPAWQKGGVNAAVLTVGGDQSPNACSAKAVMESISHLKCDVADQTENLAIVATATDLVQEVENGRFAILLNIEGGMPLEGSLENLERFYDTDLRFMTLTWNERNKLGDGSLYNQGSMGLTRFGRQVIETAANKGMVIDLSHASEATFWESVRLEQGNLIASHSNVAGLCPHPRNLTDEQIRALADQDGLIGVTFFPELLNASGNQPKIEEVIDHIAHIGELVGIEYVALGTDYIDFAKEEIESRLRQSGAYHGSTFEYPRGLETIHSLPNLTQMMWKRGFNDEDISAVLGNNFLRTCRRIIDKYKVI